MTDTTQEQDYLDQSDEDFLNQPVPTSSAADDADPGDGGEADQQQEQDNDPEDVDPVPEVPAAVPPKTKSKVNLPDGKEGSEGANEGANPRAASDEPDFPDGAEVDKTPPEGETPPESDATPEEIVKKLFAPFKASGVEMQVKSVDEAIQLMQMGFDYQKKAQKLSQHRRTIETLKKHSIGDNELSLAIDVLKGNKDAIGKLVADHNLSYEDLFDRENAQAYVPPTDLMVDQKEAELNEIYTNLQTSPHFSTIDNILRESWDVESAKVLVDNPKFLTELESDLNAGRYAQILPHFNHAKTFGNPEFQGMNDLQLYCAIGTRLFGQNNQQVAQATQPAPLQQQAPVIAPRPAKPATQPQPSVKKVAPTTQSHNGNVPTQETFLDMPDDAFKRLRG